MAISDLIGSPGFAGDHLGFPSASWLSLGLAVTLSDSPAPPDLDLGVSVAPLAPPVLGGSRFPLRNHWNSSSLSRAASGLGCSSSTARPRRDYFGSSRYLFFYAGGLHRGSRSLSSLTPPLVLSVLDPLVALSLLSGSRTFTVVWYRVSAVGSFFFLIGFGSWLSYFCYFCLICKLGY